MGTLGAEQSFLDLFTQNDGYNPRAPRVREPCAEQSFLDLFKKDINNES